jgi:hypothetical protein
VMKLDQKNSDISALLRPFKKQMCDAIPLGSYGLRHISCGHNLKWAVFE